MISSALKLLRFSATGVAAIIGLSTAPQIASATPFTTTVPGENIPLPDPYPDAGGVAIVMIGDNGNIYYQFSDPTGAFRGYQFNGQPAAFRGNPFTINNPIPLDCGIRTCTDYFGGNIDRMYVRFSAYDGDTQRTGNGGFDEDEIDLIMNGTSVGNWSDVLTEKTNNAGTQSFGFEQGFGNNSFNTGWFNTNDQALLNNILATGQTSTQVLDASPNDNYWDFRRGNSLPPGDQGLRTIAPGYEFEKTANRTDFQFSDIGTQIQYTYTVTNIGSVDILSFEIEDDKIPNAAAITCDRTSIDETTGGGAQQFATCTGFYTITQEDYDNQSITNVAQVRGTPRYGALGDVQDSVTINSTATLSPSLTLNKTANITQFSAVGDVVTYTYNLLNDGQTTLTDIVVTDDKIPGTICTIASLVPQAPNNAASCNATYTVTQNDIDDFVQNSNQLTNVATVAAQDPNGANVPAMDTVSIPGPTAAPALTILKTALQPNFDAVNDLIQFEIEIRNTGNVTWPAAPTITDALITNAGGVVTCPAGSVAPNTTITCTADYRATQPDLNAEEIENIATASIDINGVNASGTANVTVPAVITTGLDIVKRLPAAADTTFDATTDTIAYEYVLTNTGTVDLLNPTIADDKVTASCPVTTIAAGASITCTSDAPYPVTQADLNTGSVTNVASASANTQTSTTVNSAQVSLTVDADQKPELTLAKTVTPVPAGNFTDGQLVTYTFTVENTGNVTLTDPIFINDDQIGAPFQCAPGPVPPAPAAGSQVTCTATDNLDAADVARTFRTNRATATSGGTTSNEDTATVSDMGAPEIALTKTPSPAGATFSALTDQINYIFTVQNTGTTDITQPITISDAKISAVDCSAQPNPFVQGTTFDCTGTYSSITQAEIDAGEVINMATASFTAVNGTVVTSPSSSATVSSNITPAMSLAKTGPANFGAVGTPVTYTFTLTNDTAQTIATAAVTDVKIPSLACNFTNIAPFGSVSCTGDYNVTQADLDRGTIDNTANATGTAPTGELLNATDSLTVNVDPNAQVRALSLDKTANITSFSAVGDEIRYSFAVTNTGTMTLTGIGVVDTLVGLNCTIPTLAPTRTNDTQCSATHIVTQEDIDAGTFNNSATATAAGAPPSTSAIQTPGPTRNADFTVVKTANDTTDVQVNQVITYSHVVTNTGNVTLTNITLTDSHTSASGTANLAFVPPTANVIATLAPGNNVTVTSSYTVTQDDIDAGVNLTNTVSGTATPPTGVTPPTATGNESVDVADANPRVSVVKTESDGSGNFNNLPTTETFTFAVTNDGNVTLSGFTLTDDLTGFNCALPDIVVGGSTTVCGDGSLLSTTYTVLQRDIDNGSFTNEVTVTDGTVTATDNVLLNGPAQVLAINMNKVATAGASFANVGDLITYDYIVTNDNTAVPPSNVTIFQPITVTDDKTTVTCPSIPPGGLLVGGSLTCTATYAVTQADLNTGSVTNTATASVTQSVIPGPNPPVAVTSAPAMETVNAAQNPSLAIEKVITPNTPTTFSNADTLPFDTISYDYTITNNGNVTIPAPIAVNDNQINPNLSCGTVALLPGDTATCTHVWTATQAAVDAGSVTNTASAVATFDGAPVPSGTDSVTAVAVQNSSLAVVKTYDSITTNTFSAGETITYFFEVTNDGNTTITQQPVINDTIIPAGNITLVTPFPGPPGLAPNASLTYRGEYVITQADFDLGSVSNTASATSGGITSPPSSVTTPALVDPSLSVEKSTTATTFTTLNEQIDYVYRVTNTSVGQPGQPVPALNGTVTITDDKFPGQTIACDVPQGGELRPYNAATPNDPQRFVECRASYFVTQADLDAGEVVNSAVAQTTFAGQPVISPFDTATVTGAESPSIVLSKQVISGANPADITNPLVYQMTALNNGNQTLSNVQISDSNIATLTCNVVSAAVPPVTTAAPAIVSLLPNESLVCEGTYTVTQADVDNQTLRNDAAVTSNDPNGDPVTDDTFITHPITPYVPAMTVVKSLTSGEPGSDYAAVGEDMTFTIAVTNSGKITLNTIAVTDSLVTGTTCNVGPLAPGATDNSCTFVYRVTQADIDRGFIDNTAMASAQPATPGSAVIEVDDTLRSVGPAREPAFSLAKDADITDFNAVNTQITYTYTVANTGNITLTAAPTVSDDKIPSVSCNPFPAGGLLPGEFITCTGTYLTTQDDLDNGGVTNIASVSSTEAPFDVNNPGGARATETVPAIQTPIVTIDKSASQTANVGANTTITYTYIVRNTGNVTLNNLMLDDQHTSATGTTGLTILPSSTITSLAPNITVTLTATYDVDVADIDAGNPITNIVTLTADGPNGAIPPVTDNATVTPEAEDPKIEAVKTVASNTGVQAGDTVTFQITVANTGNVTLDTIAVADTLRRQDGTLVSPAPVPTLSNGDGGTLSPAEIWTYEITHTLTQMDIDAGGLSNTATASGESPSDTPVSDVSNNGAGAGSTPTPFAIPSMPQIEAGKTVAIANTGVGETVTFEITITNTGNVTMSNVGIVSETLTRADGTPLTATTPVFAGADNGSAEGTLQVGEIATYTVTYVLDQDDVDAGGIENTANVTGTPPTGSPVTDVVDTPAVLTIAPAPTITMAKTLAAGGPTFNAVGQILTYNFTVTNTGNVTLTDPIVIDDPLITNAGGTITCPAPPLAPMGMAVCSGTYAVTQNDLDTGSVMNTATATVPNAPPVMDSTTTPAQQTPALEVVKEAVPALTSAEFVVDRAVTYNYTVTNTGNTTLTDPITVADNLIPVVTCPALPTGGLLPMGNLVCTGTYVITATDVQVASVTNLATATSGTVDSPQVSETIPASGVPALNIVKTIASVTDATDTAIASGQFNAVGDKLTFRFVVTNTGQVSFANPVNVTDDHFPNPIACFVPDAATNNLDLTPTESATCEATYIITQDDLDAGEVVNSAFAQTTFGAGTPTVVTSPPATETVSADPDPMLEVVKTVDNATYANIGDVLTYTFTVTNTGNQTLTNVVVTDSLITGLNCTVASLAPMGNTVCTDTITITQAELDANEVVNTANVTGITPAGGAVGGPSAPVTSTAPTTPSVLSMVKTAIPSPFGAAGSTITYGFAVTNAGPFTLENVTVTDPLGTGFTCVIPTLTVGETNSTSCRMPYIVTQDDVNNGSIFNEATVIGDTLFGRRSTATADTTTPGPAPAPSLEVIKTATVPSTVVGETVTYRLSVENTGNVTLLPPTLTDTMTRIGTGRPTFLTTPFTLQSGNTNGDNFLDVDETWIYTATYQLTQSDVNAGGVSNTVLAEAVDKNGVGTNDRSDDGVSGNGNDNPTLVPITTNPVLDVTKSVTTSGSRPNDTVVFRIEAANRGNVDITGAVPTDTLTRRDGTILTPSAPVRVAPDATATTLSPGNLWAWEVSYVLTQEDVDAGGIANVAVVTGRGPANEIVTDVSSDDDPNDGNPANDPTELNIAPMPSISTVKVDTTGVLTGAGDAVTFDITVKNDGNITLSNVVLADVMTNSDGTVLSPVTITPDPTAGVILGADDEIIYKVSYTLTQDDVDSGGVSNTATGTGTTPTGLPVSDVSDDGDPLDGNTVDDPTVVAIPQIETLDVAKTATTPVRITGSVFETVFTITVQNTGNVTHTNLSVVDDMTVFVAPATLVSVATPVVTGLAQGGANPAYDGVGTTETLSTGSVLNVGATATIEITVRYDIAAGSPAAANTADVTSARVAAAIRASVTLPASSPAPDILADKTITSAGPYRAGSIVDYQLTFTNRNTTPEGNLRLVDMLPAGMAYVPNSATFNGAATPAPTRMGRRLEWSNVTIAPGATVTVTLSAQLLSGGGSYVNEAVALDSTGQQISNTATARVDVSPEAVFDCSDVIGKVFDDRNGNGYQDPPPDVSAAITDQDYDGSGKFGVSPAIVDQQERGEPGLAGVQLVTVRGDIITTDQFGRYSVPCALLPGPTGSNFTLKLDDRSLPTGYRVTTENPRTLRLTSGIMTEMNFGASLANLVDIDLLAAAFQSGTAQPVQALVGGVDGLVAQIASTPSVLRLTYYTNGESSQTARARLQAVEALIRDRWRGPYELRIETTIARVQ